MDVENLAKELILKNMTPEQQMAVLDSVRSSVAQAKEVQKRKIGENVDLVVQALKKIESDIRSRFDDVGNAIEKRVSTIKDGRDGINGKDGRDGKDGRNGRDGAKGDKGERGQDGRDGINGVDGVSVANARIDFDGSLIITLSSGVELNVGEVVAPDLAESIKVITNGGGTSQFVLDTLTSLQTQITNLIPSQTGNSGKFLTTNGTALSWASVSGSGLSYQGTWNASTNTPTLTSSVGTSGYYYIVSVAGSTNLDGITDWQAGDWLIFNGSTWQKIDQSWATAGANDNITSMTAVTGGISSPDFIQFDTAATVTNATGKLYYNSDDQFQTLSFQMNGNQIQHIGEELYYRVKLSSAATKGQVLMFTGTVGASGGLTAAPATGLQPEQANYILGVAAEAGSTNDWVFVTTFGEVKSINTTGGAESWAQGDVLYYNPSVTGGLTKTKPAVPNAICLVAAVVHVGSSNGVLFVRPTYGSVLGGTDGNVNFTSLASGNTLIYDAVAGVWENAFLTDGTGISITEGAGSITIANSGVTSAVAGTGISVSSGTGAVTITNTAPDQTVALTGGTGISTSGTYPNFTITNSAPDQTVALTGAGTTSISGTYPNFTITSNDQYAGTVTSITAGTGLTGGTITTSGTVALEASGVTAGSYTSGIFTVDTYGRVTAVTNVTAYRLKGITYLTSGTAATYTTPANVRAIYVECVGGGAGGGGVDGQGAGTGAGAGGGSGAGCVAKLITSPSATYTYTIGAGGAGGASGVNNGVDGGNTTFTDGTITLTGSGGNGGLGLQASATNANYQGAAGGDGSGGDIVIGGQRGGARTRGNFAQYFGGFGGGSIFGQGNGGAGGTNAAGEAAVRYGCGGGGGGTDGTTSNYAGGAGFQGVIRITEYY